MTTSSDSTERTSLWVWWVCGLLLLASTINYMDRQTLSATTDQIKREFGLNNEQLGLVEMSFGLAFAVGASVFGFIADKTSVRWLYPTVLLLWSAMGFATGLVETYAGLLLCRIFLGLFEAGHWPCALKTTQRLLPSSKRTLGNSVLQSGTAIGAMVTPLIVKSMVDENVVGSWRFAFQIVGAVGAVWVVLWLMSIKSSDIDGVTMSNPSSPDLSPSPRRGGPGRGDDFVSTSDSQAASLPHPPHRGEGTSEESPLTLTLSPADGGEGTRGGHRQERSFLEVICSRKFLVLVIVVISINLCWHQFRFWMKLFLREGRGYDNFASLDVMFWFNVMTDIGCLSAGLATALLHRRGQTPHASRCWVFGVCALLVASGALIPLLEKGPALIAVLMTVGVGALGLFPCYYAFTQELSVTHQGKVSGSLGTIAWIFPSLWHWQFGRWVDEHKSYDLGMCLASLMPLVAITALCLLWPRDASRSA